MKWTQQFSDLTTYLINLIPNLLAEVVVVRRYIDRIREYQDKQNYPGVAYVYSLIFRKVFFYKLNEADKELE